MMISVNKIGEEKARDLRRVLSTILSSTLVETVFGQVIDGLPVNAAYIYETTFRLDVESRDRPSDQSVSIFRHLRDSRLETELQSLSIGPELARAMQDASLDSPLYSMLLLLSAAVALHNIAAHLYFEFHPNGEPPAKPGDFPPLPGISLSHPPYVFHHQYPHGIYDTVGYWAEWQVFGGVVLSERASGDDHAGVYIHPAKGQDIFQVSQLQLQHFGQLNECRPGSTETLLPFVKEPGVRQVSPYDPEVFRYIYRDRYEREIYNRPYWCKKGYLKDDPDLMDFMNRARSTQQR